jgi:hypothetical protein
VSRLVGVDTRITDEEWDRLIGEAAGSSFLDTRAYASAAEEAFPNTKAAPRLYTFDDGVEVLVPGVEQTALKGAVRVFTSVPPSDYGGLLSASRLGPDHVEAIATDLTHAGFGRVTVYESPLAVQPALPDFTHVLDVSNGLDGLIRAMNTQTRQAMHRAMKNDVRVETRRDDTAIDEFYRLYLMSVQRWGEKATWVRPVEYLRSLIRHGEECSVLIRMAYLGDSAIGGQVDYCHGDVCVTGWRAFDYEYRALYPNLRTLGLAVAEEHARGVRIHDMGPSAGLEGLEISKDRCGGVRLGFRVWVWESAAHKVYRTGRRSLDRTQAAVRAATSR